MTSLTSIPEHVQEAAEWWAENNARFWRSRAVILGWVGDNGPVPLAGGKLLGYMPDGNNWNGDGVADVMPALIKNAEITVRGPINRIERLLSMTLEEFPGIHSDDYEVKRTVDATAANAVIRAGGEAAEKLLPHRVAKNKLGVR